MHPFLNRQYNLMSDTTKKLCEDLVGKGRRHLESPDESEAWLHAESVGAVVDRFRPKETDRENVFSRSRCKQ
jgi:hypothetical protein